MIDYNSKPSTLDNQCWMIPVIDFYHDCSLSLEEKKKVDMKYSFYYEKGNEYVHEMLKSIDPISYKEIHPNNRKRVIRALEVYKTTGKAFSEYNAGENFYKSPYDIHYFVLNMNRDKLYERINLRSFDEILEKADLMKRYLWGIEELRIKNQNNSSGLNETIIRYQVNAFSKALNWDLTNPGI